MRFIDWNNNGEIDPEDIAIDVALDDDNKKIPPSQEPTREPYKVGTGCGCLTGTLTFLIAATAFVLVIVLA